MGYYDQKYRKAPYGTLWLLFLLILAMAAYSTARSCHAGPLQDKVLANSAKYLKVREAHNDNRSPEIDTWLKYLGLPMGQPYCAAFAVYNYHEAGHNLPRIGRCSLLWQTCRARELTYKTIDAEAISTGIEKMQAGDIIIWRHGKDVKPNFNGHAGLNRQQTALKEFDSREANTQPSATGNQREGGGVYDRHRTLAMGTAFEVVGVIRVR